MCCLQIRTRYRQIEVLANYLVEFHLIKCCCNRKVIFSHPLPPASTNTIRLLPIPLAPRVLCTAERGHSSTFLSNSIIHQKIRKFMALLDVWKRNKTRMHSSGMRTAHSILYQGVSVQGVSLDRDPPPRQRSP